MLEFKIVESLNPNLEILKLLNNFTYKTKVGHIKTINLTNLKVVEPIKYIITKPTNLTIYEYKLNEISNKNYYIKEYNRKYDFNELEILLVKLNKNHWLNNI